MPFEKFFLCWRNIFILSRSHTSTTKIKKKSESRTLFRGDCPRFPRSLSWKKSRAFRRVWHKSLLSQKQRNRKQQEGYVPPSRFVFRLLKSSIACVRNCYGLLSIHHASGGMESCSYPYNCVDLSDQGFSHLT